MLYKIWSWLAQRWLQLTLTGVVLLLILAIVIACWDVSACWDVAVRFLGGPEHGSFRVLTLLGGVIAIGLAIWRSTIAERQVRSVAKGQYSDRFAKAVEQAANEQLTIRLGGLASLEALSHETAREYMRVWIYLGDFLRWPPKLDIDLSNDNDRETVDLHPDIATIASMLRNRSREQHNWENGGAFSLSLHGAHLGLHAHLSGAHLKGASLRKAHLEGANLRKANLQGANLSEAHLQFADLSGAYLEMAYLEMAHLEMAHLEGASLQGARLEFADLRRARLQGAHLRGAALSGANLRKANLEGANLRKANLEGARLEGADLEGADLEGASLRKAHLEGANLRGANLRKADLRGAHLYATQLDRADLRRAKLQEAVLQNADLPHADLSCASCAGAYFIFVDLSGIVGSSFMQGAFLVEDESLGVPSLPTPLKPLKTNVHDWTPKDWEKAWKLEVCFDKPIPGAERPVRNVADLRYDQLWRLPASEREFWRLKVREINWETSLKSS